MARGLCSLEARRVGANHASLRSRGGRPPPRSRRYPLPTQEGRSSQQRFVRLHAGAILSSVGSQRQGVLTPLLVFGNAPACPCAVPHDCGVTGGSTRPLPSESSTATRAYSRAPLCRCFQALRAALSTSRPEHAEPLSGSSCQTVPRFTVCLRDVSVGLVRPESKPPPGPTARGLELEAELVAVSDR